MSKLISKREKEVLQLIAEELTMREIAESLFISHHTAISHRKNLLFKLKARNTAGLVRRGFETGIFQLTQKLQTNSTSEWKYAG